MQSQQLTSASSSGKENKEYECPVCCDRGIILCGENSARVCNCQVQKKLQNLFKSSQITPAFRAKTFDSFITADRPPAVRDMFECAKDYAKRFSELRSKANNWMALLGEPGAGKTHLSIAVANELMKNGIPVLYFQHVEGLNELRDMIKQDKSITNKLDQMKKTSLLIWDDLFWGKNLPPNGKNGKNLPREFELEVVFEVLNYRYLNLLPTIINTNCTQIQLYEINKTIGSRIIERSKGHMVLVEGMNSNYRISNG